MPMRILFIVPSTGYYTRALSNPLGVLYIATYLKKFAYDVKIYDRNVDKENIDKLIETYDPDIVGVSIMSARCLKDALKVSKAVKRYHKMLIWGGQVPTMSPDLCFECEHIDYIISGEGEITWLEFIQKIENFDSPDDIDGLVYKKDGKITTTKCREFANLEDIPNIDWSLVNPENYYQKFFHSDKMLWLCSSKGCPHDCTFCGNREYHQCKRRKRPVDMVIEEIKFLIETHDLNAVYFSDELWCFNRDEENEFCHKVKENGMNFVWGCTARIGQYSRESLQTMFDSNCRWLMFGVESGSSKMLSKIRKGIKIDDVERCIKDCLDVGITPIASFIIGFPDETEEDLKETVKLIMKLKTKLIVVYHFYPMPGSHMQQELVERGSLKLPCSFNEYIGVVATEEIGRNFSKVPSKDLRVIRSFFNWLAFSGKDSINQDGKFAFARQTISDMFNSITKKGCIHFLAGLSSAAKEFLYVVWHVVAYPRVRKKYGLYVKNKQ